MENATWSVVVFFTGLELITDLGLASDDTLKYIKIDDRVRTCVASRHDNTRKEVVLATKLHLCTARLNNNDKP